MFVSVLALSAPAFACGGLFCDVAQPVVQNAERIIFEVDRESGFVDAHVQIFYEGPANEFAWIVPVPAEPELFVSTQSVFDRLGTTTGPIFSLNRVTEGRCAEDRGVSPPLAAESGNFAADSAPTSTIDVISQQQVGPYDTIVLKAESEEGLINFLQTNGYELPSELSAVLAPYIAFDAHFVALRLSKDQDVGDISPLGMTYAGDSAMIPIQLTSVAAADDMRLEVYVFSDQRAVPRSYLHVKINEAAIDWWTGGSNYSDVITQAADEAGSHAFATDYFGPSEAFAVDYDFQLSRLRGARDAVDWIYEARNQGVPANAELANVVLDHVTPPRGVDPVEFVRCPDCYSDWNRGDFDALAATEDLDVRVLDPMRDSERLFEQPLMTRMTSSLSAVEMTKDPVFVLNPDMSDEAHYVPQTRTADEVFECGAGRSRSASRRRLVLADGREIELPSQDWFFENETTEIAFLEDLGDETAQIIEQLGEEGEGEVLTDLTDRFAGLADDHNRQVRALLGCGGCTSTGSAGGAGGLAGLVLLGLAALRRRR